jgi:hypothetical protein
MDSWLKNALWQQFGATIDMLGNAMTACPDELWHGRLWSVNVDGLSPDFAAFWYLSYHTLFWLDLYLTGTEEGFMPPPPFTLAETDPAGVLPERPYTKEELFSYLVYLRKKCQTTILDMSDEQAQRPIRFPWVGDRYLSLYELLLDNMRHVQEHATQLNLFLGQQSVAGVTGWVARAKAAEGGA